MRSIPEDCHLDQALRPLCSRRLGGPYPCLRTRRVTGLTRLTFGWRGLTDAVLEPERRIVRFANFPDLDEDAATMAASANSSVDLDPDRRDNALPVAHLLCQSGGKILRCSHPCLH